MYIYFQNKRFRNDFISAKLTMKTVLPRLYVLPKMQFLIYSLQATIAYNKSLDYFLRGLMFAHINIKIYIVYYIYVYIIFAGTYFRE